VRSLKAVLPVTTALTLTALSTTWAATGAAARLDSGIRGRVLYGPTCPVQRVGQTCTRPYQATIAVHGRGGRLVAKVRSSSVGYFSVRLPPGRYVLVPEAGRPYPRSSPQSVTVRSHRYATVTISYDSGIR
jgi:hypothetical protein